MNNRFREIRKALNMTQKEMGAILGITNTSVSVIEKGDAALTERNQNALCEKLNVNKEWLQDGIGEMFLPNLPVDDFSCILSEIEESDDEFIKNFLWAYWQLDEKGKQVIKDFLKALVEGQKK